MQNNTLKIYNPVRKKARGRNIAEILRSRPSLRTKRKEAHKQYYRDLKGGRDMNEARLMARFNRSNPLPESVDDRVKRRYSIFRTAWVRLEQLKAAKKSPDQLARHETRVARFWEAYATALERWKRSRTDDNGHIDPALMTRDELNDMASSLQNLCPDFFDQDKLNAIMNDQDALNDLLAKAREKALSLPLLAGADIEGFCLCEALIEAKAISGITRDRDSIKQFDRKKMEETWTV